MLIIRRIEKNDLESLLHLAQQISVGVTSLPADPELLAQKIQQAEQTLTNPLVDDGLYFFVMESTEVEGIIGCAAIVPFVGQQEPFYSYKLDTLVQHSELLRIHKSIQVLTLVNNYQGASELCSLYLLPAYRRLSLGRILSYSRFLYMATYPERFAPTVIAEIRGVSDEKGFSPFWQSLGKHFFGIDFPQADYLSGLGKKQFVADLMPKFPVYVDLLTQEAQAVIGQPHPHSKGAYQLLHEQGFYYRHYVDIFDAGPTVEARISEIKTIRESYCVTVSAIGEPTEGDERLLSTTQGEWRATLSPVSRINQNEIILSEDTAKILCCRVGDTLRVQALGAHPQLHKELSHE